LKLGTPFPNTLQALLSMSFHSLPF
jgi:hypothetical protein